MCMKISSKSLKFLKTNSSKEIFILNHKNPKNIETKQFINIAPEKASSKQSCKKQYIGEKTGNKTAVQKIHGEIIDFNYV